jgi:hypothetical protein
MYMSKPMAEYLTEKYAEETNAALGSEQLASEHNLSAEELSLPSMWLRPPICCG